MYDCEEDMLHALERNEIHKGDVIVIDFYKEEDWEKLSEDKNAKVLAYKHERYNLNAILKRQVIFNKHQ